MTKNQEKKYRVALSEARRISDVSREFAVNVHLDGLPTSTKTHRALLHRAGYNGGVPLAAASLVGWSGILPAAVAFPIIYASVCTMGRHSSEKEQKSAFDNFHRAKSKFDLDLQYEQEHKKEDIANEVSEDARAKCQRGEKLTPRELGYLVVNIDLMHQASKFNDDFAFTVAQAAMIWLKEREGGPYDQVHLPHVGEDNQNRRHDIIRAWQNTVGYTARIKIGMMIKMASIKSDHKHRYQNSDSRWQRFTTEVSDTLKDTGQNLRLAWDADKEVRKLCDSMPETLTVTAPHAEGLEEILQKPAYRTVALPAMARPRQ